MSWNPPGLTWLITGASSGLGLALCRLIQQHAPHDTLIATSRNPSRTPDLVQEIESHSHSHSHASSSSSGGGDDGRGPSSSRWLKLDLDDPSCASVITDLEASGTQIDVLVNAAGFALLGAGELFSEEEARRQMETNFFGPYRLMRAVVPHMRRRRRGMIVNLSSGAGCFGRPSMSLYGASKSAMDGEL
jgi:NAD(P)-dependent dehydrogenase (short-subunit alcohol dehydrogenase family)